MLLQIPASDAPIRQAQWEPGSSAFYPGRRISIQPLWLMDALIGAQFPHLSSGTTLWGYWEDVIDLLLWGAWHSAWTHSEYLLNAGQ
jgi:hypothetical protein